MVMDATTQKRGVLRDFFSVLISSYPIAILSLLGNIVA
jgi:hypothetical protein